MLKARFKKGPVHVRRFCRQAAQLADAQGVSLYLVGGCVRDLLLGSGHVDVDCVVEGDGAAFAVRFARKHGWRCVTHRRFGTATLEGPEGFKVDVASARRETYENPGALPRVERGTIQDDLLRRDFSVNAMAMALNKKVFGRLIDGAGGARDLKAKVMRVLHPESFIDDPTRIVRAVRFEERLGFRREPATARWMRQALAQKVLFTVQKHRLRDELVLLFREPKPYRYIKRLHAAAGFGYISPRLRLHKAWAARFRRAGTLVRWFEEHLAHRRRLEAYTLYMSLFFFDLSVREVERVVRAYAFRRSESQRIMGLRRNAARIEKILSRKGVRPSVVYKALEPLSYEVILGIGALSGCRAVRRAIKDFLLRFNGQRIHVTGEDLKAMGLKPGPAYKCILERLLLARLDGRVATKEEELAAARRLTESR